MVLYKSFNTLLFVQKNEAFSAVVSKGEKRGSRGNRDSRGSREEQGGAREAGKRRGARVTRGNTRRWGCKRSSWRAGGQGEQGEQELQKKRGRAWGERVIVVGAEGAA
jgi:hypothetical protein